VQEKAIAHPTDSRLLEVARSKLVAATKAAGIKLKQTFAKEGPYLARKAARYAHARQWVPIPHPSATDTAEILDIFRCSKHELAAMLLVIVGQSTFPKGLFVGAVHGYGVQSLHPDAPRVTA
jgi:hypothetical protein